MTEVSIALNLGLCSRFDLDFFNSIMTFLYKGKNFDCTEHKKSDR